MFRTINNGFQDKKKYNFTKTKSSKYAHSCQMLEERIDSQICLNFVR